MNQIAICSKKKRSMTNEISMDETFDNWIFGQILSQCWWSDCSYNHVRLTRWKTNKIDHTSTSLTSLWSKAWKSINDSRQKTRISSLIKHTKDQERERETKKKKKEEGFIFRDFFSFSTNTQVLVAEVIEVYFPTERSDYINDWFHPSLNQSSALSFYFLLNMYLRSNRDAWYFHLQKTREKTKSAREDQ